MLFIILSATAYAQRVADSIVILKKEPLTKKDSIKIKNFVQSQKILVNHPYFNFNESAVYPQYTKKTSEQGKEIYFYILAGLLLVFAIFKAISEKYFSDLMHLFLRRSLKQRQLKQQLIRDSLPSLLFNIFFVLMAGFYATLMAIHYGYPVSLNFWKLWGSCTMLIGCVYLIKYFILKFIGWAFHIQKLTDNYIFLIFLINKIFAIMALPLLLLIALSNKPLSTIGWTLSWVLVLSLIIYRYFAALSLIRKEKGVNLFHFILYVAAFEVLPTLMLYKALLLFLK